MLIGGIRHIASRPGVARIASGGTLAFGRGLDVDVEFEPAAFDGGQGFLLAAVLDRFFGLYTSVNSFTRTTARIRGRANPVRTWPARAGYRTLL